MTPAASNLTAYIQLARLEKPVGIWLVYLPALMGLTLAERIQPQSGLTLKNLLIFFLGSLFIRSAGCVINDIADRDFDKQVTRTKSRPLATGALSLRDAYAFLAIFLLLAATLIPFINPSAWLLVPVVLLLAGTYPLMKRFTYWPQLYLGFCMNISLVFAYIHVTGTISIDLVITYLALIFWTLAYDTVYGHGDKRDDINAGVKSLALHPFGQTKGFLYCCYSACFGLLLYIFKDMDVLHPGFWILVSTYAWCLWRIWRLDTENPAACLKTFKDDVYAGLLMWIGLVALIT